jgi:hypothetical protein
MYYSYVEIEYVATSFSPARTDLALKLLKPHRKKIFDTAFNKTTWHLQPSNFLFFTPRAVLEQVNTNNNVGLRMFTAPVNHNMLDKKNFSNY